MTNSLTINYKFIRLLTLFISSICSLSIIAKEPLISVIDDAGNTITLSKPAKRIIALAPHIVENIFSAGAGQFLVGSVNYADYPEEAQSIPKVGGYDKYNIEAIAALKPDVIFAWQSGIPAHFFEKFKQLNIPLYIDEPSTIPDVADAITNIGILTGTSHIAEQASQKLLKALEQLQHSQANKAEIAVFYQVWSDPLYTVNGEQIISDVIRLCGGRNIFADESIKAPIISIESVIERNPQVILTGESHPTSNQSLNKWKQWPSITAVKFENLFVLNADIVSRHTARIVQGAESLCEKLDIARKNLASK